jgi:cytochrome c-type biogenesis protein CcmH
MLFWIISLALAVLVAATVLLPLLRRGKGTSEGSAKVAIYRDQLAEVDRDLARGVLDPAEAERTRTEISRRLLSADRSTIAGRQASEAPRSVSIVTGVMAAAVLVGGATALYSRLGAPGYPDLPLQQRIADGDNMRQNRPSQAEAEAAADALRGAVADLPDLAAGASDDYTAMVAQLREMVPTRPDDLDGWVLLARHEAALGNYVAATRAQERVIALKGDDATVEDHVALVDRMVAAAGGMISPEAEALLERMLARDPGQVAARYYIGLLYAQTDRPDIAFRLWRDVVAQGDAERDVHVRLAAAQVEEAAFRAGATYTLPPQGGPSVADIAAAQDMEPQDRETMIRGMVANLSDRLATEGGPVQDWARLIAAYGVLGETTTASEIYVEARDVFGTSPDALAILAEAAASAGLPQ